MFIAWCLRCKCQVHYCQPPKDMHVLVAFNRRRSYRMQAGFPFLLVWTRMFTGTNVLWQILLFHMPKVRNHMNMWTNFHNVPMLNNCIFLSDANCLSDERCDGGICKAICNSDDHCVANQICHNRMCDIGCRSDNTCPSDESCINNQCRSKCMVAHV